MGQKQLKIFQQSGRQLLPEELSAEVLKELKNQVRTRHGEEIGAAVIGVPAAFDMSQCEATRRAAELAGLSPSPLLQEPVAAALAYGFQSGSDKVFWLVYDFGGGTFDAAVIRVREGVIEVVNHAGDNYLGGKNIDWDIVEKLLVPQLTKEHPLTAFDRNNPKWRSAMAKLKLAAEAAKIDVSVKRAPATIFFEDPLCVDDRGTEVYFEYELTPDAVQRIIDPLVTQSTNLCLQALREKGLSGRDIEKVILVGGTSLFPWLHRPHDSCGPRGGHLRGNSENGDRGRSNGSRRVQHSVGVRARRQRTRSHDRWPHHATSRTEPGGAIRADCGVTKPVAKWHSSHGSERHISDGSARREGPQV
jgi:molecular chaperone DnaK